ncbi:MAG: hypothetical protein H5T62_14515, partial [Anaerolineae bacterium]|nr:hypothetical protein [Anaerolineae bacterium]
TKYETDPRRKKVRRQLVIASEHFGVLEGLRGGVDVVLGLMDELRGEGYVVDAQRQWNGGGYTYPVPTKQGWERLEEGRLFS